MAFSFITKLLGDPNLRIIKAMQPSIDTINALEPKMQTLDSAQIKAASLALRHRVTEGGETLDAILPEAFALCREVARRTLGQRHYDVQIMGSITLHNGDIAEMRTGEGKTLTATLAVYLNALSGKGVHVVTVNDYLARRDAVWMGQVYDALGLTVSCINHERAYQYDATFKIPPKTTELTGAELEAAAAKEQGGETDTKRDTTGAFHVEMDFMRPVSRREAYQADITYGTNNEYGFEYLRDNMVIRAEQRVQRELNFAIIDEVDSILIDEARTPLIISAPAAEAAETYYRFADVVRQLAVTHDFTVDEKMRAVSLTESGIAKLEKILGLNNIYEAAAVTTVHHIEQALRAEVLYLRDRDYVVREGEVIIVDEFTGRLMNGRRYSEGLHQAIEAKERVKIQRESQTLATITFQNLFRLYKKLAGMTGTAATEAEEFSKIYNLEVTSIPTNKTAVRNDHTDRVYKTEHGKYLAVVEEIKQRHAKGQPVLVGTISINKNEVIGDLLRKAGIPHELLNAKNHEREAQIIAQAGRYGAVTIATNMAGRGVDILLGGNPQIPEETAKIRELGGLCVIGTERHESRRIDNQLRGRAGRQGDPGETIFFLSMEDDLMRIFGSDRMKTMMDRLSLPDDVPIEHRLLTSAIGTAQQKVESHHFDSRKHLLDYDDVLNKHREALYRKRNEIVDLSRNDVATAKTRIMEMVEAEFAAIVASQTVGIGSGDKTLDVEKLAEAASAVITITDDVKTQLQNLATSPETKFDEAKMRTALVHELRSQAELQYDQLSASINETLVGEPVTFIDIARSLILRTIDNLWIEHLNAMQYLRTGIGLQGYGQRDPLVEYKRESYRLFTGLINTIQSQVVRMLFKMAVYRNTPEALKPVEVAEEPTLAHRAGITLSAPSKSEVGVVEAEPVIASGERSNHETKQSPVGRNDACPCGSGHKYKKCHGA